jgi:pyruvate dehydrogenase E2 component (dihydrolipoamide acetyltransferase)
LNVNLFCLPDLGEGLTEAEIVTWHVAPGQRVTEGQPLVAVETDKAVVDVPSPRSGTLARLCAAAGERLQVGDPLVEFADSQAADGGSLVGTLPEPAAARPASARATPRVRARAAALGVDLDSVAGSGPGGAILESDIEQGAEPAAGWEALSGVRRAMARRMAEAAQQVAPATLTMDADLHRWPDGEDVTLRLAQAMALACRAVPALNAWYDHERMARRLLAQVNLGLAVDSGEGLFVPVIRDVASQSGDQLASVIRKLQQQVSERSIEPAALRGQTITLSNFGSLGGRHAALVVVPPQVAIVGAGRVEDRVLAVQGNAVVHPVLPLSLTFDHRAITGAEASEFLAALVNALQSSTHQGESDHD